MSDADSRLRARAYQLEMFEASTKSNIVVAMATGSGKTEVACLRIEAELRRTPGKLVWFTAPNVVLAEQQHHFLSSQLPEYQMRTLLGYDKVDLWRNQKVWDAALAGMHVVVSTPQVLLDALNNAFIRLSNISLLVIDEAHHCHAGSASAKIMQKHYFEQKHRDATALPCVLGLTASLRISEKTASIEDLERNLDAICRTPTEFLDDYAQHVHLPELVELCFVPTVHPYTELLKKLSKVVLSTTFHEDPYYLYLISMCRKDGHETNDNLTHEKLALQQKFKKVQAKKVTPAIKELRAFERNAIDLHQTLGPWASDCFIRSCVRNWHEGLAADNLFNDSISKQSLAFIDRSLVAVREVLPNSYLLADRLMSHKARRLIDYLAAQYHEGIAVIIFVERRATAFALCQLLSQAPELHMYRVFAFVGLASSRSASLTDVADRKQQKKAFADFRRGSKDICIATSVAEEGVDVQAVNLVIRFDDPKQFVSYVQSRGRARKEKSKFVRFRNTLEDGSKYTGWSVFEKQLEQEYRKEKEALAEGRIAEVSEQEDTELYIVPTTNARLDYDNAVQHLQHFCAVVGQDQDPLYILSSATDNRLTVKIVLPSCVPPNLQVAYSRRTWQGEKSARKDAAFQAYKALHESGLVTDNLVPFQPDRIHIEHVKHGLRQHEIPNELQIWRSANDSELYSLRVCVKTADELYSNLILVLPILLASKVSFQLCESASRILDVSVEPLGQYTSGRLSEAKSLTQALFKMLFDAGSAFASLSDGSRIPLLTLPNLGHQRAADYGLIGMQEFLRSGPLLRRQPLLLWKANRPRPYIWYPTTTPSDAFNKQTMLTVSKVRKLQLYVGVRNFAENTLGIEKREKLPISEFKAHSVATEFGPTMLLVPSILHMIAARMRAQYAKQDIFESVGFSGVDVLTPALISKSASGFCHYERLEFLGDAYLKFRASLQMFVDNPAAMEGMLTEKVHQTVSNLRLEKSALDIGLSPYITTEVPSQKHWKLPLLAEHESEPATRKITSKTLADVVESTLAAAYLDGEKTGQAQERCTAMLKLVLPEISWTLPTKAVDIYLAQETTNEYQDPRVPAIEFMFGYRFRRSGLLRQALTRSSRAPGDQSFERLEFLGDAILDQVMKDRMYKTSTLNADRMTDCRHALASHSLLAYQALKSQYNRHINAIDTHSAHEIAVQHVQHKGYLTDLIQFHDSQMRAPVAAARQKFNAVKVEIDEQSSQGSFPWTLLRSINAPKVCSDIIESLIAAVYLDSGASLLQCEKVVGRLGVFELLDQMIGNDRFEVRTPSTRLRILCAKYQLQVSIKPGRDTQSSLYTGRVIVTCPSSQSVQHYESAPVGCDDEARSLVAEEAYGKLLSGGIDFFEQSRMALQATQDSIMTDVDDLENSLIDEVEAGGVHVDHDSGEGESDR